MLANNFKMNFDACYPDILSSRNHNRAHNVFLWRSQMLHTEVTTPVTRNTAVAERGCEHRGELPRRIQFRGNLEFVPDAIGPWGSAGDGKVEELQILTA